MYNPYGMPGAQKPQGTGYYQQMQQPQQTQQPQQPQQPQTYNQVGGQNTGFGGAQPNMNSFSNLPQMSPQQLTGYNANNPQYNQANVGQTTGNYFGQQNAGMLNVPGVEANSKPASNFAPSVNYQAPQAQPLQNQGTGFYNVPFQQPQIQQSQSQPQTQQPQQPQQVQLTGMQPQPIGQQRTGPQPQLMQHQQTGFGQSQPLLPQQTGFYLQSSQQQTPLEPLKPTATGFVNSFANNGINNDVKIPARRLSFITANDQAKFEKLFRSRVPNGSNTISGNDCRAILMKSGLQPSHLAKIWALCDSSKAGELLFPEFALAMHLVNDVLQGDSIPYELDSKTKNEVSSFIDAINLSIASESYADLSQSRTPFDNLTNQGTGLQAQNTGFMPQTSFGMPLQNQLTGGPVGNSQNNFGIPLQSQITGSGFPNAQGNFGMPLQSQITGGGISNPQGNVGMPLQSQLTGGGVTNANNFGVPLQSQITGGGAGQSQNFGYMPQTSFGMPVQPAAGTQLSQQLTGNRLQPQNTGLMPQTSFNAPLQGQATGNGTLQSQFTGGFAPGISTQNTGNFRSFAPQNGPGNNAALNSQGLVNGGGQPQSTGGPVNQFSGNMLQQQLTGGPAPAMPSVNNMQQQPGSSYNPNLATQSTGNLIPQQAVGPSVGPQQFEGSLNQPYRGMAPSMPSQSTGSLTALQSQQTGFLPPSGFNPTMPLTAQKTGFGNNELYSQSNFNNNFTAQNEDSIVPEEKSLFYKIFDTYDAQNRGLLDSTSAVEIFRKSGLNRNDLEHIWNLCDVNNSGSLNRQEFALGMHLVYRRINGHQLPNRLPLSLIPSSTKIIDNVKNQLKNTRSGEGKQKTAKIDALSYKNNDDAAALPSFRNRRKVFTTAKEKVTSSSTSNSPSSDAIKKKEKITLLRNAIKEKRDRLNAERNREQSTSEHDEMGRIETLKAEIKDLPQFSNVENEAVPAELRERFDDVISKLPPLFSQITDADNEIANARIQLFKLKSPSPIMGSGPNGEITEDDRKKAKSKALLKARMDALTGKQVEVADSLDQEEKRYNAEISKIRSESAKNQHIIDDIRRSISEISASLKSNLNGGIINCSPSDFGKWEFGIGLESDVRRFINGLNSKKFQARSNNSSFSVDSPHATKSQQVTGTAPNPQAISGSYREDYSMTQSNSSVPSAKSAPQQAPPADEGEDDEERHLREQLEKLKLKKKTDKEKRLAELRRQIEEAEIDSDEEQSGSASHGNVEVKAPLPPAVLGNIPSSNHTTQPVTQNIAKPSGASVPPSMSSTPTGGRNPFFRHEISSTSSFDVKAAQNQRKLQRGLGDDDEDDGWSDDEPKQPSAAQPSAGVENKNVEQVSAPPVAMARPQQLGSSSVQAPVVPVAPPLPAISSNSASLANPPSVESSGPVPLAPPLPQVSGTSVAPPIPTAPPLPQVNSGAAFTMPPPPSLPGSNMPATAQAPQSAPAHEDSDDVLSLPDSVASEEGFNEAAPPTGIPPPPPLP